MGTRPSEVTSVHARFSPTAHRSCPDNDHQRPHEYSGGKRVHRGLRKDKIITRVRRLKGSPLMGESIVMAAGMSSDNRVVYF